jgi:hypothetical protein
MNISLHIVYESKLGKSLTAAKTYNRSLIKQTADTVINEAFEKANFTGEADAFVGELQKEEAERLKKVLRIMIPELTNGEVIDDRLD